MLFFVFLLDFYIIVLDTSIKACVLACLIVVEFPADDYLLMMASVYRFRFYFLLKFISRRKFCQLFIVKLPPDVRF